MILVRCLLYETYETHETCLDTQVSHSNDLLNHCRIPVHVGGSGIFDLLNTYIFMYIHIHINIGINVGVGSRV